MTEDEIKTQKFSIYLFKAAYTEISQVLLRQKMIDEEHYEPLELQDPQLGDCVAGYLKTNKANKVDWVPKMRELFKLKDLYNSSNSLIFFVKANDRIFAFTNGYAQYTIDTSKIEWDFGLKVALNSISQNQIRGIDTRKLSLSSHQKREISSTSGNLNSFELDFDAEFINSITGKVSGHQIGSSLHGSESLKVSVKLDLKKVVDYCTNLVAVYQKTDYQQRFSFYDKLHVNKDPAVFDFFVTSFRDAVLKGDYSKIVLAYPNIEDFYYFSYRLVYDKKREDYADIGSEELAHFISTKKIDFRNVDLKDLKVFLVNDEGEAKKKYSILDYIVYEFSIGNERYIYSNRQVFAIDDDFYTNVVNDIHDVEISSINGITLPPVKSDIRKNKKNKDVLHFEPEGEYNLRVALLNSAEVICLDKSNFRNFPGRSQDQIEICDIATRSKELICVKFYKNSSAVMSHLFQQGFVSADLLAELEDYRKELAKATESKFGKSWINPTELVRTEITFVYAIGMHSAGSLADNLPFFSKISLRQNIKDIKKLNFDVRIVKIEVM